jgi:hypothetical protein
MIPFGCWVLGVGGLRIEIDLRSLSALKYGVDF